MMKSVILITVLVSLSHPDGVVSGGSCTDDLISYIKNFVDNICPYLTSKQDKWPALFQCFAENYSIPLESTLKLCGNPCDPKDSTGKVKAQLYAMDFCCLMVYMENGKTLEDKKAADKGCFSVLQ